MGILLFANGEEVPMGGCMSTVEWRDGGGVVAMTSQRVPAIAASIVVRGAMLVTCP